MRKLSSQVTGRIHPKGMVSPAVKKMEEDVEREAWQQSFVIYHRSNLEEKYEPMREVGKQDRTKIYFNNIKLRTQ